MEEIKLILQNPRLKLSAIATKLRDSYIRALKMNEGDREHYIEQLFRITGSSPNKYDQDQWDKVKCIMYTYIYSLRPNEFLIPDLRLDTNDFALFHTLTLLYSIRPSRNVHNPIFLNFLQRELNIFIDNPHSFYYRTNISFLKYLTKIVVGAYPYKVYQPVFFNFLQQLPQIPPSEPIYAYCSDLLKIVKKYQNITPEIAYLTHGMLKKSLNICPSTAIQYIFPIWCDFYINKMISFLSQSERSDQLDTVTLLFEQVSRQRIQDLPVQYAWYTAMSLYESLTVDRHKARVLAFICQSIRSLSTIRKNRFLSSITKQYQQKTVWPLFHFTTNLITTLSSQIIRMKPIKCIVVASKINSDTPKYVSWDRQASDTSKIMEIDAHLYSKIAIEKCVCIEDASEKFDKFLHLHQSISKCIQLTVYFIIDTMKQIAIMLEDDSKSTILMYYFRSILHNFLHFVIASTHKSMMLLQFGVHDRNKFNESTDFYKIYDKFSESFRTFPETLYPIMIQVIVPQLLNGIKKHKITIQFVDVFMSLIPNNPSFMQNLITCMMQTTMEQIPNIDSLSNHEALTFQQWILFMIRLAKPHIDHFPNQHFGYMLLTHQKYLLNYRLINMKQTANQRSIVKALKWYIRALSENTEEKPPVESLNRLLDSELESFLPSVRRHAIKLLLDFTYCYNRNKVTIYTILKILSEAFLSKDPKVVKSALDLLPSFLSKLRIDNIYTTDFDKFYPFFKNLFPLLNKGKKEMAVAITTMLPKLSLFYTLPDKTKEIKYDELYAIDYGVHLQKLLISLENQMEDTREESNYIFLFLTNIFLHQKLHDGCLYTYLCLLTNLMKFDKLEKKVNKLLARIGEYYLTKNPAYYFVQLLLVAARYRSLVSSASIKHLKQFASKCQDEDHEKILDLIIQESPEYLIVADYVTALSIIVQVSPSSIKYNHILYMIKSYRDNPPREYRMISITNKFLKLYLETASYDDKFSFLNDAFRILARISSLYRPVFIKRMSKLNIPLPIDSLPFYDEPDKYIYNLSAAIACGIQGQIEISRTRIDKILSFQDSNKAYEYIVRLMCLIKIVFKKNIQDFLRYDHFISGSIVALIKTLSPPMNRAPYVKKSSKKCFKYLLKYYGKLERLTLDIDKKVRDFETTPLQSKKYEEFLFIYIITKNIPHKLGPTLIQHLFKFFIECSQTPTAQKMKISNVFIILLKIFALPDYKRSDIRSALMPAMSEETYHIKLLRCTLDLLNDQNLSFQSYGRKYIIRFFAQFHVESIKFLLNAGNEDLKAYTLLEILCDDKTFRSEYIMTMKLLKEEVSSCKPATLHLLAKLAKKQVDSNFIDIIDNMTRVLLNNFRESAKQSDNDFYLLSQITKAYLRCIKKHPKPNSIFTIGNLFCFPAFFKSPHYYKYVQILSHMNPEILNALFKTLVQSFQQIPQEELEILLILSIKKRKPITEDFRKMIWALLDQISHTKPAYNSLVFHCYTVLIKRDGLNEDYQDKVVKNIATALQNSSPDLILRVFKLSIALINIEKLPPKIHQEIVEYIFTFPKFLSTVPYQKCVQLLLQKLKPPFEDSLAEAFRVFCFNEIASIYGYKIVIMVLMSAPDLVELLPFSIIVYYINSIKHELKKVMPNNTMPNNTMQDIDNILNSIINLCGKIKITNDELKVIVNFGFKILHLYIKDENPRKSLEYFFFYVLSRKEIDFPIDIINHLPENTNKMYLLGIGAIANKFLDVKTGTSPRMMEFFDKAFKILEEPSANAELNVYLSHLIINFINVPQYKERYFPYIKSFLEKLQQDLTNKRSVGLTVHIVSKIFESSMKSVEKINEVTPLWNYLVTIHKKGNIAMILRVLITGIYLLSPVYQIHYLHFILEKTVNFTTELIESASYVVQSPKTTNIVKRELVNAIIERSKHNINNLENLIHVIPESDESFMPLLFNFYINSKHLTRIRSASILYHLLGNNPIERLDFLWRVLKPEFWNNETLTFVILLIPEQDTEWGSFIILAERLSSSQVDMVEGIFAQIITQDNKGYFESFLGKNIHPKRSNLISGMLLAFKRCKIEIDEKLIVSGVKITKQYDLLPLSDNLGSDKSFDFMLLPHTHNDMVFAYLYPKLNNQNKGAAAEFFLGHYEEACKTQFADQSIPLLNRISYIAREFISNMESISILDYLQKPGKKDHDMLIWLDKAMALSSQVPTALQFLGFAQQANILYSRTRKSATIYDLQRIITADVTISVVSDPNYKIDSFQLDSSLVPMFKSFLNMLFKKINCQHNQFSTPLYFASQEESLIFTPSLCSLFPRAIAFSQHGFISVTMNDIATVITELPTDIRGVQFLNTLFLSNPTLQTLSGAYGSCIQMLKSPDAPLLHQQEAAARLLNIVRIGLSLNNDSLTQEIQNITFTIPPEVCEILKFWLPQVVQLSFHSWFESAFEKVNKTMGAASLKYASNQYVSPQPIDQENYEVLQNLYFFLEALFDRRVDDKAINNLNVSLPYTFPKRETQVIPCRIIFLHDDVQQLSDDLYILNFDIITNANQKVLACKCNNSLKAVTFSNALIMFDNILKHHEATRTREIQLESSHAYEIGSNYYILMREIKRKDIKDIDKRKLVNRIAVNSFIRYLFNAPASDFGPAFPVLPHELHIGNFKEVSSMNISSSLIDYFGKELEGYLFIAFAAIADAFLHHIEAFRAVVELLICDEYEDHLIIDEMLTNQDEIEKRLLNFAPPQSIGMTDIDVMDWAERLSNYIDKSIYISPVEEFSLIWI